jgi:hypothetical protein
MTFALIASPDNGASAALGILGVGLLMYFLPLIIGRNKRDVGAIFAVNLFLGWTLIGWVVALAWALKHDPQPAQVILQQSAQPASMLCSGCGKYSIAGVRFCSVCGQSFMMPAALPSSSLREMAN